MYLLLSIFYFSLVKFVVKFYRWTFLGFFYLCFYIIAAKGERIQSHVVRKHVKWILLCLLIFYKFYMRICRLSMLWFDFSILEGLYFLMDLGIIFHIFRAKTFTCLYSWFTRFPNVVWFFYKMEIIIHYFSWYSIFLTWKSQLQEFGRLLVYTFFAITLQMLNHGNFLYTSCNPVHTGRKLNVHKTYILYTFDLRPVSTGKALGLISCRLCSIFSAVEHLI